VAVGEVSPTPIAPSVVIERCAFESKSVLDAILNLFPSELSMPVTHLRAPVRRYWTIASPDPSFSTRSPVEFPVDVVFSYGGDRLFRTLSWFVKDGIKTNKSDNSGSLRVVEKPELCTLKNPRWMRRSF